MNLEVEGFTREQLEAALFSPTRKVRYEFTVADAKGKYLGNLNIKNAVVSYDSTASVMRTFKGTADITDYFDENSIDFQITPWMCLEITKGREAKWSLGVFLAITSVAFSNGIKTLEVNGYDLSKIAYDDKISNRFYPALNSLYTANIGQMLGEIYQKVNVEDSSAAISYTQEWELGTSKLDIINGMCDQISYNHLYFDESGEAQIKKYIEPANREVGITYADGKTSVIIDDISSDNGNYIIPNKWVRYTENVNQQIMVGTYINNDADNPYSIVSRGRTIVDSKAVEADSQKDLDQIARKDAMEAMQTLEKVQFSTLNIPGHGFRECIFLNISAYGILGKYEEKAWEMNLTPGGKMSHICEKVVNL